MLETWTININVGDLFKKPEPVDLTGVRIPGFYYVSHEGEWTIAEWFYTSSDGGYFAWYLFGAHEMDQWNCPLFYDGNFTEINEVPVPFPYPSNTSKNYPHNVSHLAMRRLH